MLFTASKIEVKELDLFVSKQDNIRCNRPKKINEKESAKIKVNKARDS